MGTMMKRWMCVISLGLAFGACKDEVASEASLPAAEPTASPTTPATETRGAAGDDPKAAVNEQAGSFTAPREEPGVAPARTGGLAGITREMLDAARRRETTPLMLVPDAADFVVRVRPAVLLAHAEAQAVWAKLEGSDASFRTAMEVVRACLGKVEAFDDVVLGFDDGKQLVLAARAKGLGTDVVWQCLQTETIARGRPFDLTITGTARGEGPQLRSDDDGVGYFPDDDTLVMVTTAWDADVQTRLRGEGKAAIEGSLAGVVARIGLDDPLWAVGRLEGKPERELLGTPFAGIQDVAFNLRLLGSDVVLDTTMDAGEAADATRMRNEIHRQLDPIKSMLPMMGMPSSVVPKIAFEAEGELVKLAFTLTSDELRDLREGIARAF
jgi:hypothetical protein